MLNLLDFFSLKGWTRISKKFGLTEEEIAYCCFIFIHLFFLAIFAVFLVGWLLELGQRAAYGLMMIAFPLALASVAALIIGVYFAIKNWRNWKLRLFIILPLCLIAIYVTFESMSQEVSDVLFVIYCFVMVLLPSWWLITSRRNRPDSKPNLRL